MTQAFPFTSKAIVRRVQDARLDLLTDTRSLRGRRYDFQALVWTLLLAMSVGARGLRQAEDLTRRLPLSIRRVTRIWRRKRGELDGGQCVGRRRQERVDHGGQRGIGGGSAAHDGADAGGSAST